MRINTTLRFHLTLVRTAIIKNTTKQHVLARMWGKSNPNPLLVGLQAGTTTLEKKFGDSLKI